MALVRVGNELDGYGFVCGECQAEGRKSKLYARGESSTCMGGTEAFWDEEGKFHVHNPNTRTKGYVCSWGHHFGETVKGSCWCGWKGP